MTTAHLTPARMTNLLQRRLDLLEDLDWMRRTGEAPHVAVERLAATGRHYDDTKALAGALTRASWPADTADTVTAVRLWLTDGATLTRRTRILA